LFGVLFGFLVLLFVWFCLFGFLVLLFVWFCLFGFLVLFGVGFMLVFDGVGVFFIYPAPFENSAE